MDQPKPVQIRAEPDEEKGRYANEVIIRSQEREVILDFLSIVAGNPPSGRLVARIFLNRFKAQDLAKALAVNLESWEQAKYEEERNAPKTESEGPSNVGF